MVLKEKYLQYFCIFARYCQNISLWEGVTVLKVQYFSYIVYISLWEGVSVLQAKLPLMTGMSGLLGLI